MDSREWELELRLLQLAYVDLMVGDKKLAFLLNLLDGVLNSYTLVHWLQLIVVELLL